MSAACFFLAFQMHVNAVDALAAAHGKADMAFRAVKSNKLLVALTAHGTGNSTKIKGFQKIGFPLCVAAADDIDTIRRYQMQL